MSHFLKIDAKYFKNLNIFAKIGNTLVDVGRPISVKPLEAAVVRNKVRKR